MSSLRFGDECGDFGGDYSSDIGIDVSIEIGDTAGFEDFVDSSPEIDGLADAESSTELESAMEMTDYTTLSDGDIVDLHADEEIADLSDQPQECGTVSIDGEMIAELQDADSSSRVYDLSDTSFEKEMTNEPNLVGELPPAMPVINAEEWETLKDVPFAGDTDGELSPEISTTDWDTLKDVPFAGDSAEEAASDLPFENTLTPISDVSDINDINAWIGDINPNFDPFDTESEFSNNCGSCAFAVHQRLDGDSDITATADNIGTIEQMNMQTGMEQVSMPPEMIEQTLLEQGAGAHAIIGIDRAEGPGHWFNAANIDGKVVAIDGQTGEISAWPPDYCDVVNWDMSVKKGA